MKVNLLQRKEGGRKDLKSKKILVSILLVILIFFNLKSTVNASIFDDDWLGDNKKSEIETTIDKDDGGLFEKIIAKMIRRNSRNSI